MVLSAEEADLLLPVEVADFVDFYSSRDHAENAVRLLRRESELAPNWRHLPCGYHGRAGSIVVIGRRSAPTVGANRRGRRHAPHSCHYPMSGLRGRDRVRDRYADGSWRARGAFRSARPYVRDGPAK